MSKKEARSKLLTAYKAALRKSNALVTSDSDNLRLLTKNKDDLVSAWTAYSDSHFDYLIRERNEEDIAAVTEEHERLDTGQDLLLISLEDRIDIVAPAAEHLEPTSGLTKKQQCDQQVNKANLLKTNVLDLIKSCLMPLLISDI